MTYMLKIGQVFYARIVIPIDLQDHFRNKELKRSLRTKSRKEAKQLLIKVLNEWQQQFFQLRYVLTMDQRPPSKEALAIFARDFPKLSPEPQTFIGAYGIEKTHWPAELMHIMDVLDMAKPPPATTIINNYNRTYNTSSPAPTAAGLVTPATHKMTVREAAEIWLASDEITSLSGDKRGTQYTYRSKIGKFVELYGSKDLADVNDKVFISKYINEEIRSYRKSYRKSILSLIIQMIRYHHQITRNAPLDNQILPPPLVKVIENVREKFDSKDKEANPAYAPEQLQLLLDSFATNPAKRLNSLHDRRNHIATIYATLIALYTGFRISDLRYLQTSDFVFDHEVPHIAQQNRLVKEVQKSGKVVESNTNKTGSSISVPMHKQLLSLNLSKFTSQFSDTDQPFEKDSTINQRLSAQLKVAGIKQDKQLMHAFKTTINNEYLALGTPVEMKEYLMSHTATETRKSYNSSVFLAKHKLSEINPYVQKIKYKLDFSLISAHLEEQLSFFV